MATATIEDKQRELERLAEFYRTVTQTHVPESIAKGVAEGWELAEDFGVMPSYNLAQKKLDAQRVMTLRAALITLEEFEEALMLSQVKGTVDVIWSGARTCWAALSTLADSAEKIWEGLVDIWNIGGIALAVWWEVGGWPDFSGIGSAAVAAMTAAWSGLDYALGLLLFAWKEENFRKMASSISKVRDAHAAKARTRAFPQTQHHRCRRRKVARL